MNNNFNSFGDLKKAVPAVKKGNFPKVKDLQQSNAKVIAEANGVTVYNNGYYTYEEHGFITVYGVSLVDKLRFERVKNPYDESDFDLEEEVFSDTDSDTDSETENWTPTGLQNNPCRYDEMEQEEWIDISEVYTGNKKKRKKKTKKPEYSAFCEYVTDIDEFPWDIVLMVASTARIDYNALRREEYCTAGYLYDEGDEMAILYHGNPCVNRKMPTVYSSTEDACMENWSDEEELETLERAKQSLTTREQQILGLYYADSKSTEKSVAQMLKCTQQAVHKSVASSEKKLQNYFRQSGWLVEPEKFKVTGRRRRKTKKVDEDGCFCA